MRIERRTRRNQRRITRTLVLRCGWETRRGTACPVSAGHNTRHRGYGPCSTHGRAKSHRAWEWAMDVAVELDVTPWEALIKSVRLAAGRSAWVDEQLRRAVEESTTGVNDGGEPDDGRVLRWLTESRKERTLLARFAKAAIDAGVAERQVRNAELEGQIVAEVIGRVIDRLELAPELRVQAFAEAHVALAALDASPGGATTLEGTWGPPTGGSSDTDDDNGQGGSRPPHADNDPM